MGHISYVNPIGVQLTASMAVRVYLEVEEEYKEENSLDRPKEGLQMTW